MPTTNIIDLPDKISSYVTSQKNILLGHIMKQIPNILKFFALITIFASITLLVFLAEKRFVQNIKDDIENIIRTDNLRNIRPQ